MFTVAKIENGFVLQTPNGVKHFKNEKKLVIGIREFLGLPVVGRPKVDKEETVEYTDLPEIVDR